MKIMVKTKYLFIIINIFLAILIMPSLLTAATYYVDATAGNDSRTSAQAANPATPWKSIAKISALTPATLPEGSKVYFKCGETWREDLWVPSSGSAGSPITFGSYGSGAKPIISGADEVTAWSQYAATAIYYAECDWTPNQVFQNGVRLTKVTWNTNIDTTKHAMRAGTWALNDPGDLLYVWATDGANLTTHTMEVSRRSCPIAVSEKNYITIKNLEVRHSNGSNLGTNGTHLIMDGITTEGAYGSGIRLLGDVGEVGCGNCLVQNNTVHHNGSTGILLSAHGHDNTIRNNDVYSNCLLREDANGDYTAGIRLITLVGKEANITGNIVENNLVYLNGVGGGPYTGTQTQRGAGIWFDTVGTGNIIRYNKIYGNYFVGIKLDLDDNASQVYGNVVYNHTNSTVCGTDPTNTYGVGIECNAGATGMNGTKVYNNTIYGNRYGISVTGAYDSITHCKNDRVLNVEVINNIFYGNTVRQARFAFGGENDGTCGSGNIYLYNDFGPEASGAIEWVNGTSHTVAAFDAHQSTTGTNISSDPKLADPAHGKFWCLPASPCINAGDSILGPPYNYGLHLNSSWPSAVITQLRSGVWDIGAYENGILSCPTGLKIISVQE